MAPAARVPAFTYSAIDCGWIEETIQILSDAIFTYCDALQAMILRVAEAVDELNRVRCFDSGRGHPAANPTISPASARLTQGRRVSDWCISDY